MFRTGRPAALAFNGMVATPHGLATAAGLEALRAGGTAVDAVIAANAVLTVVYPDQTSIGGDCFLLIFDARSGQVVGLNGSGRAPAAADRVALRARFGQMPKRGIHTVTVPGTIDAWAQASERFGRLGLDRLLQPAIRYARDGFPVTPSLADSLAWAASVDGWDESFRRIYLPGGAPLPPGARLSLPELAGSLERIAREGRDAFYTGVIAERILATSRRLGGTLTADDLAHHRGEWVQPVTTEYRGVTVAEFPPNSQGLTALIELNLVEQVNLGPWGSADHLHPLIEAKKLAFAVRDAELTDPAFRDIDTARLASKAFARDVWTSYVPLRAGTGQPALAGDTVYLCAVDQDGNAASLIQSVYLAFGSGIVADGTGILLQCRGAYFSLEDDHPNRLEGGKRTLHTLMPGMLLRDGQLLGPIGTQGGDAQAQVHLQLITNLIDFGFEPQAAIEAPRWVAGGGPGSDPRLVALEGRFPDATFADLQHRGHTVVRTAHWDVHFGHAQMIMRDGESGLLRGGADPRADGVALGY
ncbi:MAG: gamma-glutamyltranspeptidase [Thermomicrobiales bacterium]|nr:MAG: gamma-glutamyltranspeptidase [Thermomicrobiales bacterium]